METKDITKEYYEKATPGVGFIIVDDDYNICEHQAEVRAALFLHNKFGGDIRLLKEETSVTGIKTPDYEWRGKLWELKTATAEISADGAIRRAIRQIHAMQCGIILDYGKKDISLPKLQAVLYNRIERAEVIQQIDIIILWNSQEKILRYKK